MYIYLHFYIIPTLFAFFLACHPFFFTFVQKSDGPYDIPHFKSGFQSPLGVYMLDSLVHTKLSCYPPAVTQKCIEYFSSIAECEPDRFILIQEADILYSLILLTTTLGYGTIM